MNETKRIREVPIKVELFVGRQCIGTVEKRIGRGWRYRQCWCGDGVSGTASTKRAAVNAIVRAHRKAISMTR